MQCNVHVVKYGMVMGEEHEQQSNSPALEKDCVKHFKPECDGPGRSQGDSTQHKIISTGQGLCET